MEHIYKQIADAVLQVLMIDGGELELASYRWILQACRQNTHVDVEVVDVGYDVSTHPIRTSDSIDQSNFATIDDFLSTYTGNTVTTYCSGRGFAAETFEDEFVKFLRDYISTWISKLPIAEKIIVDGEWDDDFIDYLCDSDASEYHFVYEFSRKTFPRIGIVK